MKLPAPASRIAGRNAWATAERRPQVDRELPARAPPARWSPAAGAGTRPHCSPRCPAGHTRVDAPGRQPAHLARIGQVAGDVLNCARWCRRSGCAPPGRRARPLAASGSATAAPMPRDAPVTRATPAGEPAHSERRPPCARRRNSSRVLESSRKMPRSALVTAREFCFSTPRIIMQKWAASITTPTPVG